jgi:hypothetical protein
VGRIRVDGTVVGEFVRERRNFFHGDLSGELLPRCYTRVVELARMDAVIHPKNGLMLSIKHTLQSKVC